MTTTDTSPIAAPPLAQTWAVNREAVLHGLLLDGVKRITLELDGQPDAQGRVKLLVRPVPQQENKP